MSPTKKPTPATPVASALKVGDRCFIKFRDRADVHERPEPHRGVIVADLGDRWRVNVEGAETDVPKGPCDGVEILAPDPPQRR